MPTSTSNSLLSRLIGAWDLQSYCHHPISDPSDKTYPLGPDARGIIVYTPDGYMSAQVVRPGQAPFPDGGGISPETSGTPADWEAVGRNFIAYSGRFWIDASGAEPCLWHEMSVCNVPGMVGLVQKRLVRMEVENGTTYLSLGVESVELEGVTRAVKVVWKKMGDNKGTKPPM